MIHRSFGRELAKRPVASHLPGSRQEVTQLCGETGYWEWTNNPPQLRAQHPNPRPSLHPHLPSLTHHQTPDEMVNGNRPAEQQQPKEGHFRRVPQEYLRRLSLGEIDEVAWLEGRLGEEDRGRMEEDPGGRVE